MTLSVLFSVWMFKKEEKKKSLMCFSQSRYPSDSYSDTNDTTNNDSELLVGYYLGDKIRKDKIYLDIVYM